MPLLRLPHYKVSNVYYIAELTYLTRSLGTLEQPFRLLVEDVEPIPGTVKPQVATHYAHIRAH